MTTKKPDPATIWYPERLDQYLNRWFATYKEARQSLERDRGYLFPYKHHFFLTETGAVKAMGLDPDDPDWKKIGWDCAKPQDQQAYKRLLEKREFAFRKGIR